VKTGNLKVSGYRGPQNSFCGPNARGVPSGRGASTSTVENHLVHPKRSCRVDDFLVAGLCP
jgi:hypothetical protein